MDRVISTARCYAEPNLQAALGGAPVSAVVPPRPDKSEGVGITAAIVIMLLAFGSVMSVGLPSALRFSAFGIGYAMVALISILVVLQELPSRCLVCIRQSRWRQRRCGRRIAML